VRMKSKKKYIPDLSDPRVQEGLAVITRQYKSAMVVSPRVENAVCPIYFPLNGDGKPEQIASGVVVKIMNDFFVFSASHVFDDVGQDPLLLGVGGGRKLLVLGGGRFSSARGRSGKHVDDPVDASVFHIQSPVEDALARIALSTEDLDLGQGGRERSVFITAGFRTNESSTRGRQAFANRASIPSLEYGDVEYSALALDSSLHIAIAFENQIWGGANWQTSPSLRGVSGGAIARVFGVSVAPPFSVSENARQLLTAIAIEQRREKDGKPGSIVGTRIGVHLTLINRFLPSVLEGLEWGLT